MKKLVSLLLITVFVPTLLLTGCRQYEDEPAVEPCDCEATSFEKLTDYLVDNDMDIPDILSSWIVGRPATAAEVPGFIDSYDIIDIRGADDYNAGHIEGAVNSTLANILTTASGTTKPILVVCYTGQTASHAVVALRLSGYPDAKVLKWGMSGWTSNLSNPWLGNSGDTNGVYGVGHANWTTDAVETNTTFDDPDLTVTATDAEDILAERVEYMITNGFKGVSSHDVLDTPGDYFINNFWDQVDVDHYGHIDGAYRIKPLSINDGEINNLNPDSTICTYCWTGQTSSMVTAYLNVIGYNAVSLKFGANSMIYSELESHKFVAPTEDYPVVSK